MGFGSFLGGLAGSAGGVFGSAAGALAGGVLDRRMGGGGGDNGAPGGYKRSSVEDPRVAAMRARQAAIKAANPVGAMPGKLQAESTSALPQFAQQREMAVNRAAAGARTNSDALQRRFAAQGGLNSGAAIKAQQLAAQNADQTREQAVAGVDANEGQAVEAAKGRNFQREGMNLDSDWKGRNENLQRTVQDYDNESKLAALDAQYAGMDQQSADSAYNAWANQEQMKKTGGLFGGGGFLGLGF